MNTTEKKINTENGKEKKALMLFVRNPLLGHVKTRLAKSLGDNAALAIYKFLLQHTKNIIKNLPINIFIFYADYVNDDDIWNEYEKYMQQGNTLGDRMENAFTLLMEKGFSQIAIIGSDCYELTSAIIEEAFYTLKENDVVVGPAADGGYYLLAIKAPFKNLFQNIEWSTASVCRHTIKKITAQNLSYNLLPVLHDVDEEKDVIFEY